jgi:ribosomal protein S12 methylthiotransferase accessory factor
MASASGLSAFLTQNSPAEAPATAGSSLYSDRAVSPKETFRRIRPFLASHGVTRLGRLTGMDALGIPVWQAISPNARSIVINQGKGITDLDAMVSAAMEALERIVAGKPTLETVTTSRNRLSSANECADPLASLIAKGQSDIGDDENIAWARGFDLLAHRHVWVPYGAATLDRTIEGQRFWQSSDGLASGNTLTEAVLHGLLERIERDAEVLWNISQTEVRLGACIDPASLRDTVLAELSARTGAAGLALRLFDITSDIGIPAMVALLGPQGLSSLSRARFLDVTNGSGAHPSRARAAIRAVTEAAQSRLTFISGARDDIHPDTFKRELPADIRRCMEAVPKPAMPVTIEPLTGAGPLLDLTLERLRQAGINSAIALRLSDPSLPFVVAKLFVPQLENPAGERKRQIGYRAISKTLRLI